VVDALTAWRVRWFPIAPLRINGRGVDHEGRDLAYLTNRGGAYSLWYVDFAQSTSIVTSHSLPVPLARFGMAVSKGFALSCRGILSIPTSPCPMVRPSLPRISWNSSPQRRLTETASRTPLQMKTNSNLDCGTEWREAHVPDARARTSLLGPTVTNIVYTHTDSTETQISETRYSKRKPERMTDAEEIDVTPDWSPDGRSDRVCLARGGADLDLDGSCVGGQAAAPQ